MKTTAQTKERRLGRPVKLVNGTPVSELPTVTLRVKPATKARLLAMAQEGGRPAYEVFESALEHLYAGLPSDERKRVNQRVKLDAPR